MADDDTAESVLLEIAADATLPATARLLAAAALAGAGRAGVAPTVIEHDPDEGCGECRFACDDQGAVCQAISRPLGDQFYEWGTFRSGGVLVTRGAR